MKEPFSSTLRIVLLAGLLFMQGVDAGQATQNADPYLSRAIENSLALTSSVMLSNQNEADLKVVMARSTNASDLTCTAYHIKILDPHTDRIYSYWYDAEGNLTTEQTVFEAQVVAYEAKYGRLSQSLYQYLQDEGMISETLIPVAIWAESPPQAENLPLTSTCQIYLPLIVGSAVSAMDKIQEFLAERGYQIAYISDEIPIIYANLPPAVITELGNQSYVAAVYEQLDAQTTLESAARTSAAPWTWERDITGSGVKVAVVEVPEVGTDDNSTIAFANPYLQGSQYANENLSDQTSGHATRVAGIIASTHDALTGIAYDSELFSANAASGYGSDITKVTDWAVRQGVDVINGSFGVSCDNTEIASLDKYYDWIVWKKHITVIIAAGNVRNSCPDNHNVGTPAKAYNVITVGAKDDHNTAETENDVRDDEFCGFSCYVDPETASENRLKPEVVAVGARINATIPESPWTDTSERQGTSYAAPIVAGQAALMMQRADWLKDAPETVKAGIMASARWTYLHDDEDWNTWASVDKMGVGAIDVTASDNSLINDRVHQLKLYRWDFQDDHHDVFFNVEAEQRIRVVIAWNSHPGARVANWVLHDHLESDFDLTVTSLSSQTTFGSYADEANYEIVEFVAPDSGSYRARIHLSRWDKLLMREPIGFAWYSGFPLP